MTFRHFLSWKPLYYDGLLPALRALGPARADAGLGFLGRVLATAWPPRRRELAGALERVGAALGTRWDEAAALRRLEGNVLRFLARECLLDGTDDDDFFGRFDVRGLAEFEAARSEGRGLILVGSHLGAHLSAPHWLYRRGVPLRMLIQRPAHVSRYLHSRLDDDDAPHPQSAFFLRRNLPPEEGSKRIFRTRSALRDGLVVYLKGDVPWVGPNTRPARFLGHDRSFQSLWAEFAALFRAPVVAVFCTHEPGGRHALTFDPPFRVDRGDEGAAVTRYLSRLEDQIRAHPSDAVGHLLWPCYGPTPAGRPAPRSRRHQASARASARGPA